MEMGRQYLMQQVPANTWCCVRDGDLRPKAVIDTQDEDGPWPFEGFGWRGHSIRWDIYDEAWHPGAELRLKQGLQDVFPLFINPRISQMPGDHASRQPL